jgi:hypothetical protein
MGSDEINMRYLILRDEISDGIGRDFMRLDETFAHATTPPAGSG